MAGNGPAKSQDMRMTSSRAVAADGSDVARERDAVSILCLKGLIHHNKGGGKQTTTKVTRIPTVTGPRGTTDRYHKVSECINLTYQWRTYHNVSHMYHHVSEVKYHKCVSQSISTYLSSRIRGRSMSDAKSVL